MAEMITFTGVWVDPSKIRSDQVRIEDIAHHLSMLCRWGGAVREFYSVAQHSVRVSRLCDPSDALWGLLHDAAEAYVGDMIRPMKDALRRHTVVFSHIEEAVMLQVCAQFDLPNEMPLSVKEADEAAWREEMAALTHGGDGGVDMTPLSPQEAEREFLSRYEELTR